MLLNLCRLSHVPANTQAHRQHGQGIGPLHMQPLHRATQRTPHPRTMLHMDDAMGTTCGTLHSQPAQNAAHGLCKACNMWHICICTCTRTTCCTWRMQGVQHICIPQNMLNLCYAATAACKALRATYLYALYARGIPQCIVERTVTDRSASVVVTHTMICAWMTAYAIHSHNNLSHCGSRERAQIPDV